MIDEFFSFSRGNNIVAMAEISILFHTQNNAQATGQPVA
jgi:hypothetical protein